MEKTFDVEIITPDRVFYKGTADLLEFNTESGEIGVYRDHIPLTTVLEPGLVTIHHHRLLYLWFSQLFHLFPGIPQTFWLFSQRTAQLICLPVTFCALQVC